MSLGEILLRAPDFVSNWNGVLCHGGGFVLCCQGPLSKSAQHEPSCVRVVLFCERFVLRCIVSCRVWYVSMVWCVVWGPCLVLVCCLVCGLFYGMSCRVVFCVVLCRVGLMVYCTVGGCGVLSRAVFVLLCVVLCGISRLWTKFCGEMEV